MNNPVCFYHRADLDGVCSAAIVRRFVPECELVGVDYGEPFPWGMLAAKRLDGQRRKAYMVDFSLPMADMRLLETMTYPVWIDHHKTAIEAYRADRGMGVGMTVAVLDTSMAACELCWHHFAGDHMPWVRDDARLPPAVRLLGAYDSWRSDSADWENCILPFQYGMRVKHGIMDPAAQVWTAILGGEAPDGGPVPACNVGPTIQQGLLILEYQRQQDERAAVAGAFEFGLLANGQTLRCICLNTTRFNSQAFAAVYDPAKHDMMLAFALTKPGQFKVGLYSDKADVDCGAIAQTFGGGGHRGAAGFHCERLPFSTETAAGDGRAARLEAKAAANTAKWGMQDFQTLGLAVAEEAGELAQAILQHLHEGGDRGRICEESVDLGALCLQVMAHFPEAGGATGDLLHCARGGKD